VLSTNDDPDPMIPWLLSQPCALCGNRAEANGFCGPCRTDLSRITQACPICGRGRHPAGAAHGSGWRLAAVRAPFQYRYPMRELLHRLKYRGQRYLGRSLGQLLAQELVYRPFGDAVLVPMPLHRSRLIERGYNQAFELARPLAAAWKVTVWSSGISRIRATAPQTGLPLSARQENVHAAFRVTRAVAGRRLVLVDDVITTGATANALATSLLAAGAANVCAVTVARG
jgi:ComF family protein